METRLLNVYQGFNMRAGKQHKVKQRAWSDKICRKFPMVAGFSLLDVIQQDNWSGGLQAALCYYEQCYTGLGCKGKFIV